LLIQDTGSIFIKRYANKCIVEAADTQQLAADAGNDVAINKSTKPITVTLNSPTDYRKDYSIFGIHSITWHGVGCCHRHGSDRETDQELKARGREKLA
jgi:hypothetical protein